ncbi:16S rRNA (uracil(1498)-N(3))-methyltransferase [Streptomyces sp. B1866]|uniref:16S rRNA (uracil(1498)-N(3))-methyltransferase n=1 Tax=Streptomyces sp. B1866 TaxID=3075431 RepID=UPI0028927F94|nr:16S rRNA (uracil(1498)-N(3))-methyltransferase [Streptomyces sp. B1866]MDT3395658.1 16S rRNA (uracil(1498)-N(3))-methyltransferase [Streptomyces sp. B1866]
MTAPVFVAASLASAAVGDRVTLDGPEGRHAVAVRRLRVGEQIVLTDGAGTGAYGTVAAVAAPDRLDVDVAEVRTEDPPKPRLTVVQALPKGERGELAVEAMTETGVDAIVPWTAARCVTQWRAERGRKSLAKWRATAREAGKQSRRLTFPEVADPMTTAQVAGLLAAAGFAAVLHEDATVPLATAPLPWPGGAGEPHARAAGDGAVLVIGPEGGVAPEELAAFAEAGARPYRLGRSVLRTSTAGTAAAALLLGRTGRWS